MILKKEDLNIAGGASCRIRTNDPEITNHVLWPTELKRLVLSERKTRLELATLTLARLCSTN